jgi:hypothetical protein
MFYISIKELQLSISIDEISGSHCGEYKDVFWDVAPMSLQDDGGSNHL